MVQFLHILQKIGGEYNYRCDSYLKKYKFTSSLSKWVLICKNVPYFDELTNCIDNI